MSEFDKGIVRIIGVGILVAVVVKGFVNLLICLALILPPVIVVGLLAEVYGKYAHRVWFAFFGGCPGWLAAVFCIPAGFAVFFAGVVAAFALCVIVVTGNMPPVLSVMGVSAAASLLVLTALHIMEGPDFSSWVWLKKKFEHKLAKALPEPRHFGDGYVGADHETYKAGL